VLGAGGVLGGAWTAGALAAIAGETGWDPASADYVIGTSAGSVFAALTASRVSVEQLLPARRRALEGVDDINDWLLAELAEQDAYLPRSLPRPLPGSLRLTLNGIRDRSGAAFLKSLSGLAPQGLVSTEPIQRTIRRATLNVLRPDGWVEHPNCWVVACDYETGDRIVFGREDSRPAEISEAVAASCAIPGYFQPVRINGRDYVDGGIHSMSNADLLVDRSLDLAVVLSPLSARGGAQGWAPFQRVQAGLRRLAAWQLEREVAALLDAGTHVVVLEPSVEDVVVMGDNVMDARRSLAVADSALRSVTEAIRRPDVRELLEMLPRRRGVAARVRGVAALLRQLPAAAASF
jgi:NTE family protein